MSISLPKLPAPPSRLTVEQSNFSHPQSSHRRVIFSHPCNYRLDITVPCGSPTDLESILHFGYHTYCEAYIELRSIIHPAFVEAFLKRGKLQLVSCCSKLDSDNAIALSSDGHLFLHLLKDSYEKLGLVGKPSLYNMGTNSTKYVVDLDLCCEAYRPGTKYYERIKMCLTNHLTDLFPVVFTWTPDDEKISRMSACKYFQSIGYDCKQIDPDVQSVRVPVDRCPLIKPETLISDDSSSVDYLEFWEWLGMAACGALGSQSEGDEHNFVSTYRCPEPSIEASAITRMSATGLISTSDISAVLQLLRDKAKEYGWCCMTVHGFQDSPLTWNRKENGYLCDGDNLYTFVLFPDGSYWLISALGSYHQTT